MLLHPFITLGSEHPSCSHPFAVLPDPSAETLREIAASCRDAPTAMLFYNRAYHGNTIGYLRRLSRLETRGANEDALRYQQGRIFIALAEELARITWCAGDETVVEDLNAAYDRAIETLEYTIKGYNLLTGRSIEEDPGGELRQ